MRWAACPGSRVLHKAGWIGVARHDNGIVLWRGGALVVTVMTYRSAGAGTSSDVLAGGRRRGRRFASLPRLGRCHPGTPTDARKRASVIACGHALGVRGRKTVSGPGRRRFGNTGLRELRRARGAEGFVRVP